ncbi:MJ0042-type zinc finger domain-containing protein [Deefgea sp. CFH1-16]|uniref:MJ0042-type zinc finger domain-containing protein n=1 Tax=Deefgea sp. CFH1-16 TaxID=2675457 RepID=UPI0015F41314|nr:MJ0042-type zinc finger domain-containing protein [Deefgea sp. CFH1-16]MBM5574960.1 hypothetical protein [Deefgea sp. CFH1-16]
MNQITCCPNCSTAFRVTDQQLSAHQGKVRCGRCAFVFHAPDFMQAPIAGNEQNQSDDVIVREIPPCVKPLTVKSLPLKLFPVRVQFKLHSLSQIIQLATLTPSQRDLNRSIRKLISKV